MIIVFSIHLVYTLHAAKKDGGFLLEG
jgi:hypothetical protein